MIANYHTHTQRCRHATGTARDYVLAAIEGGLKELGFSDNLVGVLSSMISLGCLFQLLSLTVRRTRVKGFVIALSITNQILFMFLYVIPLVNLDKQVKTIIL